MLELLFKGLLQWLFDMVINITEYLANSLLTIFTMDLSYFEKAVPVTDDIFNIITCLGWALLLGNLAFQSAKAMMAGLGFEGEAPQSLFARTFVMTFFLVFSRQVCDIGLGITKNVIALLEVPEIVQVPKLPESTFHVPGDASWLLAIIVGAILVVQVVKLFFEIGERYVVLAVLTILSPLAFSMGGSKSTGDIFRGWARMFGSMCLMVVLGIVFLKFMLSAMSVVPTGVEVIPWTIFVVAIAKTGRKVDALIMRIGLNPAFTGDPLGGISRMPGMLVYLAVRNMAQSIGKSAVSVRGGSRGAAPSGRNGGTPPPTRPSPVSGGGTQTVHSPAEFAAGETVPGHGIAQANIPAAGTGNSTLHRQPATRPPVGAAAQNAGRDAPHSPAVPAARDTQHGTAFQTGQHGETSRVPQAGQSHASAQARQAPAPSAARPSAQARTAGTAGRGGLGGTSNGQDFHSYNSAGSQNNSSGVRNGTPQTGRDMANIPSVHTQTADIRSDAVQRSAEMSAHSEIVSVRQNAPPNSAGGRTPTLNGAATGQARPPARGVIVPQNPAKSGRDTEHNRPSLPSVPGDNPVHSAEPASAHPFAQATGIAPAHPSGRAAANAAHSQSRPQAQAMPRRERAGSAPHAQAGNAPVPAGSQAGRREAVQGMAVQRAEKRGGNGSGKETQGHIRPTYANLNGRANAGSGQVQKPLPKPAPPCGRTKEQGDEQK